MNIFIFPNFQKENALCCAKEAIIILQKNNFVIYIDNKYKNEFRDLERIIFSSFEKEINNMDFVAAIGGDGTILRCARSLLKNDVKNTKLIGINTGRLGFMSSLESDELSKLSKLNTSDYKESDRFIIEGIFNDKTFKALNDIVVYDSKSKMCEFYVYSNSEIVGMYRANGIIFSTPTGSTAYALSAGGPVIQPEISCIEMTLICPHSLFARPIIFSSDSIIELRILLRENQQVFITSDGEAPIEMKNNDVLKIVKSDSKITLIDLEGNTFFDSLNKKLMHSIK